MNGIERLAEIALLRWLSIALLAVAAGLLLVGATGAHAQCVTVATGAYTSADGRYRCAITQAPATVPGYPVAVPSISIDCATTPRGPLKGSAWTAGQCIAAHPSAAQGAQVHLWPSIGGPASIGLRIVSTGPLVIADRVLPGAEGAPQAWTPAAAVIASEHADVAEACIKKIRDRGAEIEDCSWRLAEAAQ